ncbi:S-adenosyl-L-methionine-dependent methyltransferase [Macrolepiota fuliginosa MF-IS2]|uniref:S-adenosyl-L-methionine-dependent methyltransferase n=1 Tax=Macrolepiota fuliginosa MF-IS2 TaxID=1400762 RepID=A0A9P5XNH7_9AGAR|nr:S-adenosyl-L-methionine-dependent methyltransferase [Macrolepiota fuliginosa MF-IS2]
MQSPLLAKLTGRLGARQALLEWKWMNEAAASAPSKFSLQDMVRRRCFGEPLQYILGTQPFGPLNLLVRPPVLIPRPETEHWVIKLSETIRPTAQNPCRLLDLGTGSGCIPLLLCHLWSPGSVHMHGVDISPHAIHLANENALLSGISTPSDGTTPRDKNTFGTTLASFLIPTFPDELFQIKPPFDVVTSNPPYIPWKEFLELPRSVSDYEDPRSLFGGPSGLEFYEAIARFIGRKGMVSPDGVVALEVGRGQANAVEELIRTTGRVRHTEIWTDPWGVERAVVGRM